MSLAAPCICGHAPPVSDCRRPGREPASGQPKRTQRATQEDRGRRCGEDVCGAASAHFTPLPPDRGSRSPSRKFCWFAEFGDPPLSRIRITALANGKSLDTRSTLKSGAMRWETVRVEAALWGKVYSQANLT